jgi:outer membrane immunogenic protein
VNTWTGFYVGANIGYGWARDDDSFSNFQPEGIFGGGQIGFNVQRGNFVFGIEADLQASDINDKARFVTGAGDVVTLKSEFDWFGTVRGRIGYAMDRTLIYFTGGFAFGGVDNSVTINGVKFGKDSTETGYVLGGGIEHKFGPSWSLKGEYQFISLDASNDNVPLGFRDKDQSDIHTVRLGINYHFNRDIEPLK